jgi:hypothetical protein
MSTYGAMQTRIADEIVRSDLTTQIQKAILTAIVHYARERLWFNESRAQLDTVNGQEYYGLPTDFVDEDSLTIEINSGRTYPLVPRSWQFIEDVNFAGSTLTSYPQDYTIFAGQIRLYPVPNGVYTLFIAYVRSFDALSAAGDTNSWMTDGEELIRSRAKWDLFNNVIREFSEAQTMKLQEIEALKSIRRRSALQLSTGRLRPTTF